MKKIVFILAICLFPFQAHAEDLFAVEKPDGSVSIINYLGAGKSLSEVIADLGFIGYPIHRITRDDLPARSDRDYWAINDVPLGKKIKVDSVKKAEKEAEKAAKKAERDAVLLKLKITEDEAKKLKDILK